MFVPAETLPADSRIWIYQSPRPFTTSEKEVIINTLNDFCSDWKAHGQPIRSSYEIRYNHFIILYADESFTVASGCSIDSSVRVIKQIASEIGVDLFDRTLISFLIEGKVSLMKTSALKDLFGQNMLDEETPTFNNLVPSKGDLSNNWIIPAGATWLKRYTSRTVNN